MTNRHRLRKRPVGPFRPQKSPLRRHAVADLPRPTTKCWSRRKSGQASRRRWLQRRTTAGPPNSTRFRSRAAWWTPARCRISTTSRLRHRRRAAVPRRFSKNLHRRPWQGRALLRRRRMKCSSRPGKAPVTLRKSLRRRTTAGPPNSTRSPSQAGWWTPAPCPISTMSLRRRRNGVRDPHLPRKHRRPPPSRRRRRQRRQRRRSKEDWPNTTRCR